MKILNTLTLRFYTHEPIPTNTPLADIAYHVTAHLWPQADRELRSRPATRDERAKAQALEIPAGPEPEDPEAGRAGNIGEYEDHFDDTGAPKP